MDTATLLAPAAATDNPSAAGHAQVQQQQAAPPPPAPAPQLAQQQLAPGPATAINIAPAVLAPAGGTEGYDMSSLDQLQAHALQLSASAGLTNLLLPNTVGHPPAQAGQQPQLQANKHQPFIFLQPAAGQGLQSLAALGAAAPPAPLPGDGNTLAGAPTGQAPAQSFILTTGGAPGTAIAAQANLGQQLFAAASGGPATLTLAPNGTLQPQQQSCSSAGIPIPMPMIIPQQQQQLVQQQPGQPTIAASSTSSTCTSWRHRQNPWSCLCRNQART